MILLRARYKCNHAYTVLIGKPEGTNPLGITGRGRDDNIKVGLKRIGFDGVDFIHLVQDQKKWRKG